MGADLNLSAFSDRKKCRLRSEPLLLLVSTHSAAESRGQKIPVPALAESADLNLSAFSERKKCRLRSEPCCCWLPRIQPRNQRQKVRVPARAESADLNLSAFSDGENADCGRNLCWRWLLRIQPRNQGTEDSGPSPDRKCGPKPVRFSMATGSGMMASGALAAERTSVVPSSTKRHGLCQRPGVFPDLGNPTSDLRARCRLRPL